MSDNLPGLSGEMGAGKPLTKAEFAKRERERKALQVWVETQSYAKVKNALNLRSNDVAREMVKRGEERWLDEESSAMTRHIVAQVQRMYELIEKSREGQLVMNKDGTALLDKDGAPVRVLDWNAVDRELKAWDRLSKLLGIDKQKDSGDMGPQVLVIDTRLPSERGEVIDGEAKDIEPPALPEST